MSNIKVAALKLAQENPEFRRALLEEISKEAAPKEKKETKAIQRDFSALKKAAMSLTSQVHKHEDFKGDKKLKSLVSKAYSTIFKDIEDHLNANYIWRRS